MASCRLFKRSEMVKPLPGQPNPAANAGEFGLVDNEDGTFTVVICDPTGDPSPIDEDAAELTVASSDKNVIEIETVSGSGAFTFRERIAKGNVPTTGKAAPAKAAAPHAQHPPPAMHPAPGSGAAADMTAVVTWTGGTPAPHTIAWKSTIGDDGKGGRAIHHDAVTVSNG